MVPSDVSTLPDAFALAETMAREPRCPGVLVFTTTLQLLYMNREARELNTRLAQALTGQHIHGVVPCEVTGLCQDLVTRLRTRGDPKDWEQVQLIRVTGAPRCPVLLRGFGVPHAVARGESRLLVLMEELGTETDRQEVRVQERYHLTEREQAVTIYLLQGMTNKEIANSLGLSVHTIKEHLQHVMQKTRTTTRTGLLARIIFAASLKSPAATPNPEPPARAGGGNGAGRYRRAV